MGTAMVTRLVAAGHDVTATNRTRAKAEVLGQQGATVVDSPRDLATATLSSSWSRPTPTWST